MNTSYQSIGLFIDGGYYAKVNEALKNNYSLSIDFRQLLNMIKAQVAKFSNAPVSSCHITENHYFRGRYKVYNANDKNLLYSERKDT